MAADPGPTMSGAESSGPGQDGTGPYHVDMKLRNLGWVGLLGLLGLLGLALDTPGLYGLFGLFAFFAFFRRTD